MRFNTKKDYSFLIIFLFVFVLYSIISCISITTENDYAVLIPLSIVLLLLAILFIGLIKTTYFILVEDKLICRSLVFRREIPYKNIRKVEKQNGIYAGIKFSTTWKGLIVSYNKYDELLISPENEEKFIEELKRRTKSELT